MAVLPSKRTIRKLHELLSRGGNPLGEPASEGKALTRVAPFELTAADGAYTGKRLKYDKSTGDYVTDGNDVPIDNPTGGSYSVGDRLFCAFRGTWEIIGGGGGGSSATLYAVVVEAISQPSDAAADPPDGMGKIKFPGDEKLYDCACLLLAETEQLLNEQVKVAGPFKYDNPGFDPQQDESDDNPEKSEYYLAVDIADSYDGLPLESDLEHGETSTIKVQKGGGELEFTVHDGILTADQYYKEDTPVLVKRTAGKLYVVDGPCPEDVEEEEEDEEEEEPE